MSTTCRNTAASNPNRKRLRVFLPYGQIFTPATSADVRLRQDETPPPQQEAAPAAVPATTGGQQDLWSATYGSWRQLPENPLCDLPRPEKSSSARASRPNANNSRITDTPPAEAVVAAVEVAAPEAHPATPHESPAPAQVTSSARKAVKMPEDYPFYCDACQKGFKLEEAYNTHMENHIYCEVPGCNFTCRKDRPQRMEEHVETLHNRIDAPNLVDTEQYLAQRKKRFPTRDNVAQAVDELSYMVSRGVLVPEERLRWMKRQRTGESTQQGGGNNNNNNNTGDVTSNRSKDSRSPSRSAPPPPRDSGDAQQQQQQQQQDSLAPSKQGGRRVPRFYVCPRCTARGAHWVSDCTAEVPADTTAATPPPWVEDTDAPPTQPPSGDDNEEDDGDAESSAPAPQSARKRGDAEPDSKEVTRVVAPVAAAKRAKQASRKQPASAPKAAPALLEKLTEESRVDDLGVLLQAFRYFVKKDFFVPTKRK